MLATRGDLLIQIGPLEGSDRNVIADVGEPDNNIFAESNGRWHITISARTWIIRVIRDLVGAFLGVRFSKACSYGFSSALIITLGVWFPVMKQAALGQGNALNQQISQSFVVNTSAHAVTTPAVLERQSSHLSDQHNVVPQSQLSALIVGCQTSSHLFDDFEVHRLVAEGVAVRHDGETNCLRLDRGNIVLSPQRNVTVNASLAVVHIAGGAIVLVMKSQDSLAVYDLHQNKPAAVRVTSNHKSIALHPGRVLVLTKANSQRTLGPDFHGIAYRNATTYNLDDSVKIFAADYSMPSAINRTVPLRQMLSSDQAIDRAKINKILIDSVMIMEATAYSGPYQTTDR